MAYLRGLLKENSSRPSKFKYSVKFSDINFTLLNLVHKLQINQLDIQNNELMKAYA